MRTKYSSGVLAKKSKALETLLRAVPVECKKRGKGKRRKGAGDKRKHSENKSSQLMLRIFSAILKMKK